MTRRSINFTGRKQIDHGHVQIGELSKSKTSALVKIHHFDLKSYEFPENAHVVIEAYHSSSGMRFDCGCIANHVIPDALTLEKDKIDFSGTVNFRVKVIDPFDKRLLGLAKGIVRGGRKSGSRDMLPIIPDPDLDVLWKIDIKDDEDPPSIKIHKKLNGFSQRIADDPLIGGIVLSEALRQVMAELAHNPPKDDSSWKNDWLRYVRKHLKIDTDLSELQSDFDKSAWIEKVVKAFCNKHRFVEKSKKSLRDNQRE